MVRPPTHGLFLGRGVPTPTSASPDSHRSFTVQLFSVPSTPSVVAERKVAGLPKLSECLAELLVVHVQLLANVRAAKRSTLALNQVEHALTKRWGLVFIRPISSATTDGVDGTENN